MEGRVSFSPSHKIYQRFKEGEIYHIRYFNLLPNNQRYKLTVHPYIININETTIITQIRENIPPIPSCIFRPHHYTQLISLASATNFFPELKTLIYSSSRSSSLCEEKVLNSMEKYFKKVPPPESDAKADDLPSNLGERKDKRKSPPIDNTDIEDLPSDPGERKDIMEYLSHQRDEVRRKYLTKGPCQPYGHTFKQILKSGSLRRFNPAWFDQYGSWLEYSISKERAFCLYCYLFKDEIRMQGGSDAFVKEGFNSWNKPDRLRTHMGKPPNSFHIIAAQKCEDLMNQNQSIVHALFKQDDKVKNEYRIRLTASIDASRFLLRQGLSFRGHFEKEEAVNKGNFLQLLKYTGEQNETISKVILSNAPGNNQMVSPLIQKDIVHSFAEEVRQAILEEIGHDVFGLLVDESADVSHKEQMGVVFRFVDKRGAIKERFIGVVHKHNAGMLIMEDDFVNPKNPRKRSNITNMHHYKVNCFCTVLDLQIQEFNDRFTEVTTDLLICMAALSPTDSFYAFDKEKLVRLAKLYPEDFTYGEILSLEQQLDIYIDNIRRDERFKSVENLGDLSCLMVKTQKHIAHPLVYRLLKLVLTLPVATASVERCFSAMKLVKTAARNRIGDQFLSDCMVCFVEKELLDSVSNEKVIERFQKMNERRVVL
uniref:TTF-type domain-containing protein n=1 Tax=Brassica oleracea var. oleracea TaxID=109376 RepID=A0A0D3BTY5_BRAOL